MRESLPDMQQYIAGKTPEADQHANRAEQAQTSVERKETEPLLRMDFEYRDKEGRSLGQATIELDTEQTEILIKEKGLTVKGRLLRTFVIKGQKGGSPVEIDIVALTGVDVPVYVLEEKRQEVYNVIDLFRDREKATAVAPLPDNPIDMAWFMHELGHVRQTQDEKYADLGSLYKHEADIRLNDDYAKVRTRVAMIAEIIPAVASYMAEKSDLVGQLDRLEERRLAYAQEASLLLAKVQGQPNAPEALAIVERINQLQEQVSATKQAQSHLMEGMSLYEIASVPVKVLEVDATKRAIEWMKQIRDETGVDLFAEVDAPESSLVHGDNPTGDCLSSAEVGRRAGVAGQVTSVSEQLRKALSTYQATNIIEELFSTIDVPRDEAA